MILRVWVEESEDNLLDLIKRENNSVVRDKLRTLLLIKTDKVTEIKELSKILSRHRNAVSDWLKKYRKGGLELLLEIKKKEKFKNTIINGDNLEKLKARLSLPDGFNTYYEIRDWIEKEFNLEVKYATVYKIVRYDLKSKLKVVRPSNIRKDKEKEINFKKKI